jgi:hypothetical protein
VDDFETISQQIQEICRYILEFEEDDFFHHCGEPSSEHIYYRAAFVLHGRTTADNLLKSALSEEPNT